MSLISGKLSLNHSINVIPNCMLVYTEMAISSATYIHLYRILTVSRVN